MILVVKQDLCMMGALLTAGGANMMRQKEALKAYKPFLVVGTPGRIAELSRDGALQARCQLLMLGSGAA